MRGKRSTSCRRSSATARSTPCSSTPTKAATPPTARWAAENVRPGGLLVGDNTYLFGRLAGAEPVDADIASMPGFHEVLAEQFHGVCIPTPDSLSIGTKK